MRDQLTQYIDLLFAGTDDAEDIRLEILQNTLDRYDDLVSQGYSEQEAYRVAISGIGDIGELLSGQRQEAYPGYEARPLYAPDPAYETSSALITRVMRAIAICMYITCVVPLFLLGSVGDGVIGLALMFVMIAAATGILLIFRKKKDDDDEEYQAPSRRASVRKAALEKAFAAGKDDKDLSLKKSINSLISTVGLVLYFVISFKTRAWYVTWLIFPIIAAINGVVNAGFDFLKEDK